MGAREAEAAIAEAKKSPATGIPKLEELLRADPEGEQVDDLALALAEARLARNEKPRAVAALEAGLRGQPQGNRSDEIRLLLAQLEQKRGRRETAYRVLAPVRLQNLSKQERGQALQLLARLAGERRDYVAEIYWLSRMRAEAPSEDAAAGVDVDIDRRLETLSRPELDQVAAKLGTAVPAARARIREAELSIRLNELAAAGSALAQASSLPLTKDDAARLAKVEAELVRKGGRVPKLARREPVPEPGPTPEATAAAEELTTVGVVLPLSGRFSRFGEESLNGILLAGGVFEEETPAGAARLRFVVRDSSAGPEAAAAAVQELAADPSVAAVIGPLLSEETEAATAAAQGTDLPLLTLSARVQGDEVPHVYRFGATPRSDIAHLAEHTARRLGLRRFGVLYPEDDYGRGLRDLFDQAIRERGGTLVKSVGYVPRERDLGPAVKELLGGGPPTMFDAVFVADGREAGARAAQALAAAGADNVRVLGARGWQHPDLIRLGGAQIEGAIFAEPFDPADSSPTVAQFTRRYHQSYGRTPDVMAAQAFDATRVLIAALPPGTDSRQSVESRLRRIQGYPGAAGTISVQPDGSVQKTPELRSVRAGRIVEVE